ncbi:MAG: hypothetical protein M1830_007737 [Pleopsidium flavum]|nr:MAG: hypothetical protein M1830_007737 [Pleopsidium flavum]
MAPQNISSVEEDLKDLRSRNSTIFHVLLNKDIPPSERTLQRLSQEAISLVAAGSLTTSHALKTITYHILANPPVLHKLTTELKHAIPDPTVPTSLTQLEQLPYLTAVITEGLRLSYGISHRLERSAPDRAIQFQNYIIPPGTPVSMTSVLIHDNPTIFPDPHAFTPERWLESNSDVGHQQRLDKYLLTFSKGTRGCVGLNLAYAELTLTLANLFRKFGMSLFDTVRERDVDTSHDFFSPSPNLASKGMMAMVVGGPS